MPDDGLERRLSAILSADVAGYSRLMAADEARTVRTVTAYRNEISNLVGEHHGRVVDATGDNVLAEFPTALGAVECAVEIQRVLKVRNEGTAEGRRMQFRIGVHLGDVAVEDERIYGDGVNIAARLEGLAEPGGICVSGAVWEQVESKLGLPGEDLGEQVVKNIPKPVRAFRIGIGRSIATFAPRPVADKPSIVVLPFVNLSGDPEQEYFSEGITEEIVTELNRFTTISVVARPRSARQEDSGQDARAVASEIGVRYVLEGSVRTAGEHVRVTARLSDTAVDSQVWSETYDRELTPENIFRVQDEIKERIAATLADSYGVISRSAFEHTLREVPESLTAYQAVLLNRTLHQREGFTPELHFEAREALERAVEMEPTYAEAWSGLASRYRDEYSTGFNRRERPLERATEAARRALDLDSVNLGALLTLAQVHVYQHDIDEFLRVAERILALNPNAPAILSGLALFMAFVGEDRGLELGQRAIDLHPDPPTIFFVPLVFHHYRKGAYGEALRYARLATSAWVLALLLRAAALGQLDRLVEARADVRELLERHPKLPQGVRERWLRKYSVPEDFIEHIVHGLKKAGFEIPDESLPDSE